VQTLPNTLLVPISCAIPISQEGSLCWRHSLLLQCWLVHLLPTGSVAWLQVSSCLLQPRFKVVLHHLLAKALTTLNPNPLRCGLAETGVVYSSWLQRQRSWPAVGCHTSQTHVWLTI